MFPALRAPLLPVSNMTVSSRKEQKQGQFPALKRCLEQAVELMTMAERRVRRLSSINF